MDTNTPVRVVAGPRRGSRGVVVEVRPQAALGMTVGVRVDGVLLFYKPEELEAINAEAVSGMARLAGGAPGAPSATGHKPA